MDVAMSTKKCILAIWGKFRFYFVAPLRWALFVAPLLFCRSAALRDGPPAGRKYLLSRVPTVTASLTLAFTVG
jgi:hypothetical protein